MDVQSRVINYDKHPTIHVSGCSDSSWQGYIAIVKELKRKIQSLSQKKTVVVFDFYHGVRQQEIMNGMIQEFSTAKVFWTEDAKIMEERLFPKVKQYITDDRVFGYLSSQTLDKFFDHMHADKMKSDIDNIEEGLVILYGIGASYIYSGDVLVYFDLARWEIQQRFRTKELDNWGVGNFEEDILRKYKRAYFLEWRVLDQHKQRLFSKVDYWVDTNQRNRPKMVTGTALLEGLKQAVHQPFRLVPYFDEGVWGGTWMEQVCGLEHKKDHYAWCFDGVPEENSLYLSYGDVRMEIPSINLVLLHPIELLGEIVYERFGAEFPIRFDFLDTMGGGNLSLQVHPLKEYIKEKFGMSYTQDESYYFLDAKEDACVYLGVKNGVRGEELIAALEKAQQKGGYFDESKFINVFPVNKHDHVLIPAGTIHCSGKNSMVLEISATPYIFTFKLWDWGRVGLDGIPRPVHIEHGKHVIKYERNTNWVKQYLLNRVETLADGEGWLEERTGLHELEFIETRRHWFSQTVTHHTNGIFNMLNLVEGEEALVESPNGLFQPFVVHYAETFIIPASINEYTIKPYGKSDGKTIATIKAFVRV